MTVGAPGLTPALAALAADGRIRHHPGRFDPAWLDAVWLVVAATDDTEVNREVSEAAEARRLFCNVVDDPALSSFQVPSIVDRSPVIVAISSSGVAPVLARRLRERIESLFDHTLGQLAGLAERYRQRIRAGHPTWAPGAASTTGCWTAPWPGCCASSGRTRPRPRWPPP